MFFLNNQDLAKKLRQSWEKAGVVVGRGRDAAPFPLRDQVQIGQSWAFASSLSKISDKAAALLQRIRTIKSFN